MNDKKLGIWLNLLFTCVFVCYIGMWSLLCRVRIFGLLIMWVILGILRKKTKCKVLCCMWIGDQNWGCTSEFFKSIGMYVCMYVDAWMTKSDRISDKENE